MLLSIVSKLISLVNEKLDTPIKRVGFILFTFCAISLMCIILAEGPRVSRYLKIAITFDFDSAFFSPFICFGFYGAIIGFMLSFGYNVTIGKLITWINMGSR